jgi:hypothetical protein
LCGELEPNRMAAKALYEEVEDVLTNRLKNALRTGEMIKAPDWVSDLAHCLALAVNLVGEDEKPRLTAFAHAALDHFIEEESGARPAFS